MPRSQCGTRLPCRTPTRTSARASWLCGVGSGRLRTAGSLVGQSTGSGGVPSSTTRPITGRPLPPSRTLGRLEWLHLDRHPLTPLASEGRDHNAGDLTAAGNHPINREPPLRISREVIVVTPHSERITAIRGRPPANRRVIGTQPAPGRSSPRLRFVPRASRRADRSSQTHRRRVGEPRIGRDDEQTPPPSGIVSRPSGPVVVVSAFEFSWTTPPRTNAPFSRVPTTTWTPAAGLPLGRNTAPEIPAAGFNRKSWIIAPFVRAEAAIRPARSQAPRRARTTPSTESNFIE